MVKIRGKLLFVWLFLIVVVFAVAWIVLSQYYSSHKILLDPVVCGDLICEGAETPETCPSDCFAGLPNFLLDLGESTDTNSDGMAFITEGDGISGRLADEIRNCRAIEADSVMNFSFNSSFVSLGALGVPYKDAILDIWYQDNINETQCSDYSIVTTDCRASLATMLSWGDIEWKDMGGIGGYNDGAWKKVSFFVENTSFQQLRSIDGLFRFRLTLPEEQSLSSPLLIDNITLRFVDHDLLLLEREADRLSRDLVRLDHVPTNSLDSSEYTLPFVLYQRPLVQKIYQTTVPEAFEITGSISGFEVDGYAESLSLGIYSFEDVENIRISVSDLVDGGNTLSSMDIGLEEVVFRDRRWWYGYTAYYGSQPWYQRPLDSFDIAAGKSAQVLITVDVPEGTPAGTYTGALTLTSDSGETEVPISFEVLNLDLEGPEALAFLYHSPFYPGRQFSVPRDVAAKDMRDHDVYSIPFREVDIKLDGTIDVDTGGMRAEIDALHDIYGEFPPIFLIDIADNFHGVWFSTIGNENYFGEVNEDFDAVYVSALRELITFFEAHNTTPVFAIADEPCNDLFLRRYVAHVSRLIKEAGGQTWVTYHDSCAEPMAGYTFTFRNVDGFVNRDYPSEFEQDGELKGLWKFDSDATDSSGNGNGGLLENAAVVQNGELVLSDEDEDFMRVVHDSSLNLIDEGTVSFWIKPNSFTTGYANSPIKKGRATNGANYIFYLFGDAGSSPGAGNVQVFADSADYQWKAFTNSETIPELDEWHHLLWTFHNDEGSRLYVDGKAHNFGVYGNLANNEDNLEVGKFEGSIDGVAIFGKKFNEDEVGRIIIHSTGDEFNTAQSLTLSTSISVTETTPQILEFSLSDLYRELGPAESVKQLFVDGTLVWSVTDTLNRHEIHSIDLSDYLTVGETSTIGYVFTNNYTRQENLKLYFMDDYWRNDVTWTITADGNWQEDYKADEVGNYGPLDPLIDYRIHPMQYLSEEELDATARAGDKVGYYTTGPANQPNLINNRFLHGFYASAVDAKAIGVYAYGDWGSQPYDDLVAGSGNRITSGVGRQGASSYQLVMPSWEEEVYPTIIYTSLREGVEDSRVIATLKKAIANHPGPKADKAQAYLDSLIESISPNYEQRYFHTELIEPIEEYGDRTATILSDLSGDDGNFAVFDTVRHDLLEHILSIQEGEDIPPSPGGGSGADSQGGSSGLPSPEEVIAQMPLGELYCESSWSCGEWGECINESKHRECYDLNNCGDDEDRPVTVESCSSLGFEENYGEVFLNALYITLSSLVIAGLLFLLIRYLKKR